MAQLTILPFGRIYFITKKHTLSTPDLKTFTFSLKSQSPFLLHNQTYQKQVCICHLRLLKPLHQLSLLFLLGPLRTITHVTKHNGQVWVFSLLELAQHGRPYHSITFLACILQCHSHQTSVSQLCLLLVSPTLVVPPFSERM